MNYVHHWPTNWKVCIISHSYQYFCLAMHAVFVFFCQTVEVICPSAPLMVASYRC